MANIDVGAEIDSIRLTEQASAPAPDAGYSHIYAKVDGLYIVDDDDVATGPFVMAQDIGARVYNNADITISNNTATALTFNSERWDTDTIHSTASNTSRLTCKTAGKYSIEACVKWTANAVGSRLIQIKLNGSTVIAIIRGETVDEAGVPTEQPLSTIYDLAVDDYIELEVWQSSGGELDIISQGNFSPEFMMQKIG